MKQVIADILAALQYVWNGKPRDPKRFAKEPPERWNEGAAPVQVPDANGDYFQPTQRGFKVGWDGNWILSEKETPAEKAGWKEVEKSEGITEQDYGEMLAYTPKLTNVALANKIKPLWRKGAKPKQIAFLIGCSESYAKHYCICFDRAQRSSNATPLRK